MQKLFNKTYSYYLSNTWLRYSLVFVASFLLLAWMESAPTFADPDSFYHLGMAQEMIQNGLVRNFHWLQFTTLKTIYIDHHLFYHILIIPFLLIFKPFFAMKLATVVFGAMCLTGLFHLIRTASGKYPELFVALALMNSPFMFRVGLAKASALAILLLLLGLSALIKKHNLLLFIISLLYVFTHGGFVLILIFTIIYWLISAGYDYRFGETGIEKFLHKLPFFKMKVRQYFRILFSRKNLVGLGLVVGALGIGLLFSPYFPTNLAFLKEQLIKIGIFTNRGIRIGAEWAPYDFSGFIFGNLILLVLYIISIVAYIIEFKKQPKQAHFFLVSSVIFLIYTLKSRRFIEYFVPFTIIFISIAAVRAPGYVREFKVLAKRLPSYVRNFIIFILLAPIAIIPFIVRKDFLELKRSYGAGSSFYRFAGVSQWLKNNTKEGEIIFHTDWSDFPMFFYNNRHNDYIVGLDPTFMYQLDPALYKLFENITLGKKAVGVSDALINIFHTRYFIVNSDRKTLEDNLIREGKWSKVYKDSDATIYMIK